MSTGPRTLLEFSNNRFFVTSSVASSILGEVLCGGKLLVSRTLMSIVGSRCRIIPIHCPWDLGNDERCNGAHIIGVSIWNTNG